MNWLYYLLEANLYLAAFYGFYRLLLHKETFYSSNRYFLLLTSAVAFILPIMQLGFLKPTPVINNEAFGPTIFYTEDQAKVPSTPIQESFNLTDWLYPIYLIIALVFTIKLGISILKIIHLWLKAEKTKTGNITLIELKEQTTAFSFFNLLFIHPNLIEKQTVLNHEMVHIKQKHSIDILFFEVLQIFCWFNPIIYFIKKDIKLLHEYIADDLSTNFGIQKHEYALFLIQNSFGVAPVPLTNQIFNQSILKRRINMLNKKRTADLARLRLLIALPLVGAMLYTSTMAFTKDYGYVDLLPEKSNEAVPVQEKPKVEKETVRFSPSIVKQSKNSFTPRLGGRIGAKYARNVDDRYITINGKPLVNKATFYGVTNTKDVIYINKETALKKYGKVAKFGAVEITGDNIKFIKNAPELPSIPPPSKAKTVKFPPPIIKPDKLIPPPPPIEPTPISDDEQTTTIPNKIQYRTIGDIGKNPLIVNDGEVVKQQKDKIIHYTAKNVTVIPKNNSAAITQYDEAARDGVIELTEGTVTFSTADDTKALQGRGILPSKKSN